MFQCRQTRRGRRLGDLCRATGTGERKVSEKAADADEAGVGNEPLIVRLIADVRTPKYKLISTQETH